MSGMARFFVVVSGSKIHERVGDADIFLDPNAIVTIIHSLTYKDD